MIYMNKPIIIVGTRSTNETNVALIAIISNYLHADQL